MVPIFNKYMMCGFLIFSTLWSVVSAARCKLGYYEQNEWYFFSHKDKKYPTGTRTNRATAAGFWKATGRDKAVLSKNRIIGMRKTLVFYQGRAPNGRKSDWIMHEYRLQTTEHGPPQASSITCNLFLPLVIAEKTIFSDDPKLSLMTISDDFCFRYIGRRYPCE